MNETEREKALKRLEALRVQLAMLHQDREIIEAQILDQLRRIQRHRQIHRV